MTDSMQQWLDQRGLGKYAQSFAENDVALDVLPDLTDADLRELGVSLGDRKRLMNAIQESGAPSVAAATPVEISAPQHLSEQILKSGYF